MQSYLIAFFSCAQDETRTHTALRPLPPQSSVYTNFTTCAGTIKKKMSGKRDSNPRPQPWQGCALPTELFPHLLRKCEIFATLGN